MAVEMSAAAFEDLVSRALDEVPDELMQLIDNCVILVEDYPPAEEDPHTLGLYDGIPLTERGSSYGGVLPDRIFIFRFPLLDSCETEDEVETEVTITVVHEIAHYFGIDDERLHQLGYG